MKTWIEYINEEAGKAGWRVSGVREHREGKEDRYSVGAFPSSLDSKWFHFYSRTEVEAFVAGLRAATTKKASKVDVNADV